MKPIVLVATLLVLSVAPARAEDPEVHGFVDASYFHDVNADAGEFGLDQAELDLIHQASEKTRVRADLEWVKDGDAFDARVEQAFMEYTGRGTTITLGRFNAPIGFELVDPHEMYQYSHSLVFTYGLPVNLTGAMVARPLGAGFDARAYAVNGWDQNSESNKRLTWGGRFGYTRGVGGAGFSILTGKEAAGDSTGAEFSRTVYDLDLSCKPEGWVFGGELNLGKVESGGVESRWLGLLLMAHRELSDRVGLTVRYDRFDDEDALVFGAVGGKPQVRQAIAVAPTLVLDGGFGALAELRFDLSDQDAFTDTDGDPTDVATAVAFEMTYAW